METLGAAIGQERTSWPRKLAEIIADGGWRRLPVPSFPAGLPRGDALRDIVESTSELDELQRDVLRQYRAWQYERDNAHGENVVRLRTLMGALVQERDRLAGVPKDARSAEDVRAAEVLYAHLKGHWGVPDVPQDDHDCALAAEIACAMGERRKKLEADRPVALEAARKYREREKQRAPRAHVLVPAEPARVVDGYTVDAEGFAL